MYKYIGLYTPIRPQGQQLTFQLSIALKMPEDVTQKTHTQKRRQ